VVGVRVDVEAPEVVVESPQPDSATSARSLRASGRVSDPKATVRVNGQLARRRRRLSARGAAAGRHARPLSAEDEAGNRSEVEVPAHADRTAPELSLLSLPEERLSTDGRCRGGAPRRRAERDAIDSLPSV
jgi:hypothetical protein